MRRGFIDELTAVGRVPVAMGPYSDMLQTFNAGAAEGKPLILFCTDRGAKMTRSARDILNGVAPEPEPVAVSDTKPVKRKG